jgi:hypothetical protein
MPFLEFTAAGSPMALSQAIEEHAARRRALQAIVVPWESTREALTMSVTSVNIDGWAIEHTNLGTITLTDLADGRTRVALEVHPPDHPEKDRLVARLDAFARQLQARFQAGTPPGERP